MPSFFEKLSASVSEKQSRLCVGIDPHPYLLATTKGADIREKLVNWSMQLATKTAPHAACFKINIAFYESHGSQGILALEEILPQIQKLAPVMLDAKLGDIRSTAAAYARACFDTWGVDSITVNPYLGMDSFAPFLSYKNTALFLLCHTSNPSAAGLQRRIGADGDPLYVWIAKETANHQNSDQLGLVVGATQTDVFSKIREHAPKTWLLCPGVGTQGGSLEETIHAGWGTHGNILISVSRAIGSAEDPGKKAQQLKEDIQAAQPTSYLSLKQQSLARRLIEKGCVLFGSFTLKSGLQSPIYIDLRKITSDPITFKATIAAYAEYVQKLNPEALAAIPLAGLPIASAIAFELELPLCYTRPPKAHGTQSKIEGGVIEGSQVLLIDDLATRGVSAVEALPTIRAQYKTSELLVLIDRDSGAEERLRQHGVELHSIFKFRLLLRFWREKSLITHQQYEEVVLFLDESQT